MSRPGTSVLLATLAAAASAGGAAAWGQEPADRPSSIDEVLGRVHLMGNADVEALYGERNSIASGARFLIDNARLYLDVDLGEDLTWAGGRVARDASFYFEWDLVREAELQNKIGSLYLRFDGVGGLDPLNVKFGRFLIPFGEEYLRESEARPENPLLSFSVEVPYGWSQGLLLFGPVGGDWARYFVSVTSAAPGLDASPGGQVQTAAKFEVHPAGGIKLSASGLRIGAFGSAADPAATPMEWSGSNLVSFGAGTSVPSVQEGVPLGPDPDRRLGGVSAWEADAVFREPRLGHLWLGLGEVRVTSDDQARYDRKLRYGVVEAVVEAEALVPSLESWYLAARYSAIGTWTSNRGYLLGEGYADTSLGYNTKSETGLSVGVGWRLGPHVVFKAEAAWLDFDLVRGAPASGIPLASRRSYAGVGISVSF